MAPSARRAAVPADTPLFVVAHHLETESHFSDRLAAGRREGDEIGAVDDQEKREQGQQRKLTPVLGGEPAQAQREVKRDGVHGAEQHRVQQCR